jgi:hypothetical protein
MPDYQSPAEEAAELLRPILDLMSGVDGGAGYARLHHEILPAIVHRRRDGCLRSSRVFDTVSHFSSICRVILADCQEPEENPSNPPREVP